MGGTSESAMIAEMIADAGFSVLVSMATEVPLLLPSRTGVESRRGRLNLEQLGELIVARGVTAIVDAAHPFAMDAHGTAERAAELAHIPYIHWLRDGTDFTELPNLHVALDHQGAARIAVGLKLPILLTIGSRNLVCYVRAARAAKLRVYARVLPVGESEDACRDAGLQDGEVISARGPFTVEDTQSLLQSLKVGTLVTKDSGRAGGVPEKIEAASREHCNVVVVKRANFDGKNVCRTLGEIVSALQSTHN
jgi:precorrin-6A/cobalt-precorrin-6A reductase